MEQETAAVTVKFQKENLTIGFMEGEREVYYVDLEEITDSATCLDSIMQVSEKSWVTDEVLGQFVRLLDTAFSTCIGSSVQGVICGFGQDHKIDKARWRGSKA